MAYLGKEYKLVKQENFDGFLKSAKLPEDQIAKLLEFKPTTKLLKDGDTYTYISTSSQGPREKKFTPGVEFEDNLNGIATKTTYTVDGNKVTEVVNTDRGTATFAREYNGDDLVVTITASTWDGVAKRYYKA